MLIKKSVECIKTQKPKLYEAADMNISYISPGVFKPPR